jgi:hypothetical protein
LMDRGFGRPKQFTDITTDGEKINKINVDISKLSDDDLRSIADMQRRARTE